VQLMRCRCSGAISTRRDEVILLRFSGDVAWGLLTPSGSSIVSAPPQPDVRAGRAFSFTPGTGALAVCYLSLTRSGGRFGLG
jgi:hypothetical protein